MTVDNESPDGIDNSESIESATYKSIKETFVTAAHSIAYHTAERSPEPTDDELETLQENLR